VKRRHTRDLVSSRHRSDRPLILNLGCGWRTSDRCVNVDWSWQIRIASRGGLGRAASRLLPSEYRTRLDGLSNPLVASDLRRGLPFDSDVADAVYHSHLLEHLDRAEAHRFLAECHRVLRSAGVLRIIVPDLASLVRDYSRSLSDGSPWHDHDKTIAAMFEQFSRTTNVHASSMPRPVQAVARIALGGPARRGDLHRWMYDRVNLTGMLLEVGFEQVHERTFTESGIPSWREIGLDADESGNELRPGSLYLEAVR
jgi:SAM-dependent methyltransferase